MITSAYSLAVLIVAILSAGSAIVGEPVLYIPEPVFKFGMVARDAKVTHPFIIKNTGGDSLRIVEVKPGCSCTQAPLEKSTLGAGDSTYMELIFKTGRYSGTVMKNTVIRTATQPFQRIQIQAYVLPNTRMGRPLVLDPMVVDLDLHRPANPQTPWSVKIRAHNKSDQPVKARLVCGPVELFDVVVPDAVVQPDSSVFLELGCDQRILKRPVTASFTIELDDAAATRYTVAVRKSARW